MIISIANEKGGVGKSTIAMTLAVSLVEKGHKVLLIDLDQQCNLSIAMCDWKSIKKTTADILMKNATIEECILKTKGLDFIPSSGDLSAADVKIITERPMDGAFILKKAIKPIKSSYDFIIIDTPRGNGITAINAFVASERIILATIAEGFATQGLITVLKIIKGVQGLLENPPIIDGILINEYRNNTTFHKETKDFLEILAKNEGTKLYNTKIRESILVGAAQAKQMTACELDKNAGVSKDFNRFVEEFLEGVND